MTFFVKLAALGGILLALLSAYPGVPADVVFVGILLSPLWLPVLFIAAVTVLVGQIRPAGKKPVEPDLGLFGEDIVVGKPLASRRRSIIFSAAILILSFALILTGAPRRVAFRLSRTSFERHVATAPVYRYRGEALGRYLGVFHVDRYAADPRGGVYFRTHAGADGIGPDTMSYGFAFRPNPKGTPFGRAGYNCSRVVGDWYVFSASDDY